MGSMTLNFKTTAVFIFQGWQNDDMFQFILGCLMSVLLGFLMLACPQIRRRVLNSLNPSTSKQSFNNPQSILTQSEQPTTSQLKNNFISLTPSQKLFTLFIYTIYALIHVLVMVLIMYMNFYIISSIILGAVVGFYVCSENICTKKNQRQHQCCDNKDTDRNGKLIQNANNDNEY